MTVHTRHTRASAATAVAVLLVVLAAAPSASAATIPGFSDEIGGTGFANRATAQALQNDWLASVAAAGGTAEAPIVLSGPGPISGVFFTAPDGTTASVARTQYSAGSSPVLIGPSANPGTASCVANGSGAANQGAGLQGNAPRPTNLVGGAGCVNGYSYTQDNSVTGEGTTRDGLEFTFSRPVLAFGAWFGDLETRTDGLGVAAIVRLYGSGNALLSDQVIVPGPRYVSPPNSQANCSNSYTGCGNNTTRWVGFVADPAAPVERMVIIVGDEDAGGTALDEGVGFIGPTFDLSRATLSLVKTAAPLSDTNGDAVVGAGDTISYSFEVENTGTLAVTSVAIVDGAATDLTCPGGTLAAGETVTCTGSHVLTQLEVDGGTLVNTAYATAEVYNGTVQSNTSSVTTDIPQSSSLSLVKSVDAATFDSVGQVLTYTLQLTNGGNVTLDNVQITDSAPGAGAFDASDCTALNGSALAPAEDLHCTVTYAVTQADLNSGSLTNLADAAALTPSSVVVDAPTASATSTASTTSALSISTVVDVPTYDAVGDLLTFTVTVTNVGTVTLTSVGVTDSGPGVGTCDTVSVTLDPTESIECTVSYAVDQGDLDAGSVSNTAFATAIGPGGPVTSPTAGAQSNAVQSISLILTKASNEALFDGVGDVLTYALAATNGGNVTLTAVGIADAAPGVGAFVSDCPAVLATLAPGDSVSCAAAYTIAQSDLDVGTVTNSATSAALAPNGDSALSGPAQATSQALQAPMLSLTKSVDPSNFSAVGEVIGYTLVITNTGNVTIQTVTITDTAPGSGAFTTNCSAASETLAPGASAECVSRYTVTAGDVAAGLITSVAVGQGGVPPVLVYSNFELVTLPFLEPAPAALATTGSSLLPLGVLGIALLGIGILGATRRHPARTGPSTRRG